MILSARFMIQTAPPSARIFQWGNSQATTNTASFDLHCDQFLFTDFCQNTTRVLICSSSLLPEYLSPVFIGLFKKKNSPIFLRTCPGLWVVYGRCSVYPEGRSSLRVQERKEKDDRHQKKKKKNLLFHTQQERV